VGEPRRLDARLRVIEHIDIDIDAHGRVVPHDDRARRALADRAGRFTILPTVSDLLVARRTPAAGGAAPRPCCSLAGDLAAFPIADLVAFIHQSRLSGLLTVSTPGAERALAFKDGEVRGARSGAPGEHIGEVALRLGYVDAQQLAAAVTAPAPIGKALVELGFVSRADLWKCIHEQVATVFHAVLLSREGVFAMVEGPAVEPGAPLSVSTQSLLMDGIRRIDEMALFRARVPGPHAYLRRRQPSAAVALDQHEEELLALVDGRRRVEDVAKLLHLDEFETTRIVYHLAEAGYVQAVSDPMAAPDRSAGRTETIASGINGILRLVVAEVAAVNDLDAFTRGVRAFMSDRDSRYAPLWQHVVPARDGSLDVALLLGNLGAVPPGALAALEPSGDAARYLFDGLRELMLFFLFQAGEALPRGTGDRLDLEVKRRFEALGDLR
jgi:hypothetical protein